MNDFFRIHGVAGSIIAQKPKGGALWKAQKWVSQPRKVKGYSPTSMLRVEIRFDDECNNRHNTFAITGDIAKGACFSSDSALEACGCLHDDIAVTFPELAHLIRWHGVTTDSPLHYIANTVYHAGDRDCYGKRAGEVTRTETALVFGSNPIEHKIKGKFAEFVRELLTYDRDGQESALEILSVAGDKSASGYQFAPKYQFAGQPPLRWHECPCDSEREAMNLAAALLNCQPRIEEVPTAWGEGKARDFDAARACGVWPDATDEELSAPPEELRANLEARLPALMAEFRNVIDASGLLWEPRNDGVTK